MTLEERWGRCSLSAAPRPAGPSWPHSTRWGAILLFGRDLRTRRPNRCGMTSKAIRTLRHPPAHWDRRGGRHGGAGQQQSGPLSSAGARSPDPVRPGRDGPDPSGRPTEEHDPSGPGGQCQLCAGRRRIHDPADFIYARSFGQDAQATANYVAQVVGVMGEEQIGSVLKHFPGYGNNVDTHTGIALDQRPYETFQTSDFLPFQAGIQAGADASWSATISPPAWTRASPPPSPPRSTKSSGRSWASMGSC